MDFLPFPATPAWRLSRKISVPYLPPFKPVSGIGAKGSKQHGFPEAALPNKA